MKCADMGKMVEPWRVTTRNVRLGQCVKFLHANGLLTDRQVATMYQRIVKESLRQLESKGGKRE